MGANVINTQKAVTAHRDVSTEVKDNAGLPSTKLMVFFNISFLWILRFLKLLFRKWKFRRGQSRHK